MLHNIFIGLTWAIGGLGVAGTIAAVVAVILLGPAAVYGIIEPMLVRFLACAACIAAVAFILATVGSYWVGRAGEYDRGYEAALSAIAAEDEEAISRATEKRNVWQECRNHNGQWDQSTGECR